MADTAEKPGGMLDARKAKAIFVLGAALYLLMVFWSRAADYKIMQIRSTGAQLGAKREHDIAKPVEPREPAKPPEKAKDVGSLNNKYDKLKKEYDTKKKEYDEKLWPEYLNETWTFDNEEGPELREDGEELEDDLKWAEATKDNWAYWSFVGRFIGSILMLVGLAFTALNGNDWERAAAVIVIGLVILGTGGTLR